MNKVIVTTTIHPPTKALEKFREMQGWTLVVIGDRKTLHSDYIGWHYLSPIQQEAYDKKLSDAIGWDCIQRRNFGFLYAYKELKADLVALVDDDNIPMDNWGRHIYAGVITPAQQYATAQPAFDPMFATNHPELWHRGFPLQLIEERTAIKCDMMAVTAQVQANLWNGDPDIDALCRLRHRDESFTLTGQFPFVANKPSPFNSQNTILCREVIPHYFLFPHIGRMDDIWAAYHVQALGYKVIYDEPTVIQERNQHNLTEDMQKECLGYSENLDIVKDIPKDDMAVLKRLPSRSQLAFGLYQKHFE